MFLAVLDPLQWFLAVCTGVASVASLGGYLLQRRRDNAAIDDRAGSVAERVTNAALKANDAALARAEKDIKHLTDQVEEQGRDLKDARIELREARGEVRELRTAVANCEIEKAGLADRVRELEAAR